MDFASIVVPAFIAAASAVIVAWIANRGARTAAAATAAAAAGSAKVDEQEQLLNGYKQLNAELRLELERERADRAHEREEARQVQAALAAQNEQLHAELRRHREGGSST